MKKIPSYFMIIIFLINCQKQNVDIINVNNYYYESDEEKSISISNNVNEIGLTTEKYESLQEIIEKYAITLHGQGQFAFQIEGNFTNSGNKEIIVFYENFSINFVYCFVLNSDEVNIESVYEIKYFTLALSQENVSKTGLSEDLGKYIIWRDHVIGCIGDFNMNGREELYLYSLSGMNFIPHFYEYNGYEFSEIIEFSWAFEVSIFNIIPDESIIILKEKITKDETAFEITEKINTYIWDETIKRYKILFSNSTNYRWNRDLKQYEETFIN